MMPKKVSLYSYIHQMNQSVSPSDKFTIAKHIANSMRQLQAAHSPPAHTHLSSTNIMLDQHDLRVYIADYNMKFMKKYCKTFLGYENLS
jgi:hypothetical protein